MIAMPPMERAEAPLDQAKATVLLFTQDPFKGRAYVAALEAATVAVEWVATADALQSRLNRVDLPRPALVMLLPSQQSSMQPGELVRVVLRLTTESRGDLGPAKTTSPLEGALNDYCVARALSPRQRQVLEMYLFGNNDKEIASAFNCSATTVYEHWRRMARKANGAHKSDVVNDFHRLLATRLDTVSPQLPSALGAPRRSIRPPGP
jgi:DNA-binding CsgD family transcriptional regulator